MFENVKNLLTSEYKKAHFLQKQENGKDESL